MRAGRVTPSFQLYTEFHKLVRIQHSCVSPPHFISYCGKPLQKSQYSIVSTSTKMASMASVSQFTFKTFQNSSPNSKLIPSSSHSLVNRINFSITKYTKLKQNFNFAVRAGEEANPLEEVKEAKPLEGVMETVKEALKEGKPLEGVEEVLDEDQLVAVLDGITEENPMGPAGVLGAPLEVVMEVARGPDLEAEYELGNVRKGDRVVMKTDLLEGVPEGVTEANPLEGVEAVTEANPLDEVIEAVVEGKPLEGVEAVTEANSLDEVLEEVEGVEAVTEANSLDEVLEEVEGVEAVMEANSLDE